MRHTKRVKFSRKKKDGYEKEVESRNVIWYLFCPGMNKNLLYADE